MSADTVELFTKDEHAIVASWLRVTPECEAENLPTPYDALENLGFVERANGYQEEDAAVASIVLERIQGRLPQWAAVRLAEYDDEETTVTVAREIRHSRVDRVVALVPHHLLSINWADTGPGYSWPVVYHATWIPVYDRYVVTLSADCAEAFGYCDFAIGSFPETKTLAYEASQSIMAEWEWLRAAFNLSRWAYVIDPGLIGQDAADRLAKKVWPQE